MKLSEFLNFSITMNKLNTVKTFLFVMLVYAFDDSYVIISIRPDPVG